MNEIDNNEIYSILFTLSKNIILPKYKNLNDSDIMRKQNNDTVTSVDIKVEEELNKILCKLLPNSLFVGEETYNHSPEIIKNYDESLYCWTVDPIDGTSNYIHGRDKFAIMISLSFSNQILQSWIYKPLSKELFCALQGQGATLEGKKLSINNSSSINQSRGSISSKYWDGNEIDHLKKIKNNFLEVSSYGCIGYEYIDILLNKREFAILSKLSSWDHIPGILLIREAGGFDSYFDGKPYSHCIQKKNLVVSSSKKLGIEILSLIEE